ncbi:MAG: hypothetical protein M1546_23665 [Chloroflexi bacterium]|nr:hypothetical protein [Chloroflexota bacterium]
MSLSVDERVELRDFLISHFDLVELKGLLFELGVSYDDLPHGTRPELAGEMILYCERRDLLGCLLVRVVANRRAGRIEALLPKAPPCQPEREKVQVILHTGRLRVTPEVFTRTVADLFDQVSPEEVTLIGVAEQGGRALVSVPAHSASRSPVNEPSAAVIPFAELDGLDQRTWQAGYSAGVWSPRVQLAPQATPAPPVAADRSPRPAPFTWIMLAGLLLIALVVVPAALVMVNGLSQDVWAIGLPLLFALAYLIYVWLTRTHVSLPAQPRVRPGRLSPGMSWAAAREVVAREAVAREAREAGV